MGAEGGSAELAHRKVRSSLDRHLQCGIFVGGWGKAQPVRRPPFRVIDWLGDAVARRRGVILLVCPARGRKWRRQADQPVEHVWWFVALRT